MNIFIMRHGEAGFNAKSDSERQLTEFGKKMAYQQGETLGKYLLEQSIELDKVIVSPYFRTQQTLAELSQGLQAVKFNQNLANIQEIWEGVTPYGSSESVCDYLDFLREEGADNVLIISHLPLVFDLVLELTQHQANVHFYPAVLAEISWNGHSGILQAVENP